MKAYIQKYRAVIGGTLWLAWMLVKMPHPLHNEWGIGLLLLAALALIPLTTDILLRTNPFSKAELLCKVQHFQLPSAMALMLSFSVKITWLAVVLALPWALLLLCLAIVGIRRLWRNNWSDAPLFSISAGLAYLSVAAVWLLIERAGLMPFGFSFEIVFLTIVHFHYAGFRTACVGRFSNGSIRLSI